MVIMKDSDDPPWISVGDTYRRAKKYDVFLSIMSESGIVEVSYDFIYTGGRLVLFFKDDLKNRFHLHEKVSLELAGVRRR